MSETSEDLSEDAQPVRERLLKAALACFLADEYHAVTTRQIAAEAGVNVSMIRYYFGSKEGLFEEMIRDTYAPVLDVLDDGRLLSSADGFSAYLKLYYDTMVENPAFPKLILKILALNHGPGKRFVRQLLERGRVKGAQRVEDLKQNGLIDAAVDADILRLTFVSLAITPLLLKDIYEQQMGFPFDDAFLARLAAFNGGLITAGLKPDDGGGEEQEP